MSQSDPTPLEVLQARGAIWRGTSGAQQRAEATGIAALDARLPGGGWPSGALSELLVAAQGIGELSLALPLAARMTQAGRLVAFVAPPQLPYGPALAQAGLVLTRTLIVEPRNKDEAVWAAEQLLRSPACGAVLVWAATLREADSRRLQLAAESADTVALVYRPAAAARATSVAALRLALISREKRLEIEVLKARGGRPGARFFIDELPAAAAAPSRSGAA